MRTWVVTGPIGAGKSLATRLLAERGAEVIDADAVGHAVLDEPDVRDALVAAFGPGVAPGGRIDRPAVARIVFADPGALARLNGATHPRLVLRLRERLDALAAAETPGHPVLAVLEAAVYFQLPPVGSIDLVIAVVAAEQVRLERLVASGRMPSEAARSRIEAQRSLLPRFDEADEILHNDDDRDALARRIDDLLARHPGILPPPAGRSGRRT